jgi:hypothetical protein
MSNPVWTASFDADGKVTLTPDTLETRRALSETLDDFHSGRLQVAIPPLTKPSAPGQAGERN